MKGRLFSLSYNLDEVLKEGITVTELWNDGWKVWKEDNAFRLVFSVPDDAKTVNLPYDVVFHQKQSVESVNQGRTGFLDGGVYHYYKQFIPNAEDQGRHIWLCFEGVAGRTSVFVNGSLVGENSYAYMPFEAEIGKRLKWGMTNDILVTVNVLNEGSRYYCGGGICRNVFLLRHGPVYMEKGSAYCETVTLNDGEAAVRTGICLRNQLPQQMEGRLKITVFKQNEYIKTETMPVNLPADSAWKQEKILFLDRIEAWDADRPSLYDMQWVYSGPDGTVLDEHRITTGFRTISTDAKYGLRINGKCVKLRGACIHHDQGLLGGETYDASEYRRVRILKEAGFNAVRCAHNPASVSLLKACDALGMYVMDEAFDMWNRMKNPQDYSLFFTKDAPAVLQRMAETDRNHPSVICYSTGNEISEIGTEEGYAISHRMTETLHQMDPLRFVTNGINGVFAAGNRLLKAFGEITGEEAPDAIRGDINECMSALGAHMTEVVRHGEITDILDHLEGTMDVLGYNYMTGRYEMDCAQHPGRVIVGTETYPKQIAENWQLMQKHPALIGDFTWTGWDYLGETGGRENYPWLQNFSGDIDVTGERKPASYYREIVFGLRTAPYIAVRSPENSKLPRPWNPWQLTDAEHTWSFAGNEGKAVTVEIYSAGEEVELFLNDLSVGRKPANGIYPYLTTFDLLWQPGTLKAVSYSKGHILGTHELKTAGMARELKVSKEVYPTENGTLVFLTVEGYDENETRVRETLSSLSITMDDERTQLLAFGSSGSIHRAGYTEPETDALHGRALAVLKKPDAKAVHVTFRCSGMRTAEVTV